MQTDPIGYSDGMNMYAYVHNNPINLIDPLGLEGIDGVQDMFYGMGFTPEYGRAAYVAYMAWLESRRQQEELARRQQEELARRRAAMDWLCEQGIWYGLEKGASMFGKLAGKAVALAGAVNDLTGIANAPTLPAPDPNSNPVDPEPESGGSEKDTKGDL